MPPRAGKIRDLSRPEDAEGTLSRADFQGRDPWEDNRILAIRKVLDSGTSDGWPHAYVRGFGEDDRYEHYVLLNTKSSPDPSATTGEIWKIGPA